VLPDNELKLPKNQKGQNVISREKLARQNLLRSYLDSANGGDWVSEKTS
jgi:hypothetical protein